MPRKKKSTVIADNIEDVLFHEQFKEDFVEFGLYSIQERAVPDVRDGLKPSQRRIVFGLKELGAGANGKNIKSARAMGDVMGKYHPHNQESLYETAARMGQWWVSNILLIKGEGNFGSIQGLKQAAPRYTEMKLSPFGERFVKDLKPGVVEYRPNYSNDAQEPTALPVDFPYLLIAGGTGIFTVAVSSDIPPHNAQEVMNTVLAYIKNPKISDKELQKLLPGPDFPTAGTVLNKDDSWEFYRSGKGTFEIRGETQIEKKMVVITEVPYTSSGNVKGLQTAIDDLIFDRKLQLAKSAKNYSNKNGIRIEVNASPSANLELLNRQLYAKSPLQSRYNCQFIALRDGIPHHFTLREYLHDYVAFQYELLINRSKSSLAVLNKELELQSGLRKAMDFIPILVELIQNSKSDKAVVDCLTKGEVLAGTFKTKKAETIARKFNFTEKQAESIINIRLRKLKSLDKLALEKRIKEIKREVERLDKIINDPKQTKRTLIKEQTEVAKLFSGDEWKRKTKLTNDGLITVKDVVKVVPVTLSVDKFGYLRSLTDSTASVLNEVKRINTQSDQKFTYFTSDGTFKSIRVDSVKGGTQKDKGENLNALGDVGVDDWTLVHTLSVLNEDGDFIFITEKGLIKRVPKLEFKSNRKSISAIKLKDNDHLVDVKSPLKSDIYMVITTSAGRVKKIKLSDVPKLSRSSQGNLSGRLLDGEQIVEFYLGNNKSTFTLNENSYKFSEVPLSKLSVAYKSI